MLQRKMRSLVQPFAIDLDSDGAEEVGFFKPGSKRLKIYVSGRKKPLRIKVPKVSLISFGSNNGGSVAYVQDLNGDLHIHDFLSGQTVPVDVNGETGILISDTNSGKVKPPKKPKTNNGKGNE